MSLSAIIRELGRGRQGACDLNFDDAQRLYGAILDGEVPDLELGAIVIALRMKGETATEMHAFLSAAQLRMRALRCPPGAVRPAVMPSYNGARKEGNLLPLLALLLQCHGVPVLIHGLADGFGRVTTFDVLRELGVSAVGSHDDAQGLVDGGGLAALPLGLLSPGLEGQLALRGRLGLRNCAHSLVKLLDPFVGGGLLLAAATHPDYLSLMRGILSATDAQALLFRGTEGEPYFNPKRSPRVEYLREEGCELLFDAERESLVALPVLPERCEAAHVAEWTRRVLAGEQPVPESIARQLACCLLGCGVAESLEAALDAVARRWSAD